MSSGSHDLDSVIAAVAAVRAPGERELSDADAISWAQQVEQLGRHVDALRVRAAGDIAERSRRELGADSLARRHGKLSGAHLLEFITRISSSDAARRVRLARETAPRLSLAGEPMPARWAFIAEAFAAGRVGVDAALTIVRCLGSAARRASVEQLEAAEHQLVDEATTISADLVGVQARAWSGALDPDGVEPQERELRGRRRFVIGREVDGMTPFWGEADPVSASQLRTWLGERTAPDLKPRFLDVDDPAFDDSAFDDSADRLTDPRNREQRTFDVLMGLLQAGVRADANTTTSTQSAANVMVVVRAADLLSGSGPAWMSDSAEPISALTAGMLACESGVQTIIVGDQGEPLALGRRQRLFSAAQRKALAVRDGGCAWPECTAPPSWSHAHHVIPWSHDGPTDVENGVLLCPFHHGLVHEGEFAIRMVDGIPHLRAPLRLDHGQKWRRMGRHRIPVAA